MSTPIRSKAVAFIVRTQLKRPAYLAEALQSIRIQGGSAFAMVVVHASEAVLAEVEKLCEAVEGLDYQLVHAPDLAAKRGYPLNVGLEALYASARVFDYLGFLDDDDVVYPFFSSLGVRAMEITGADVVYAATNRKVGNELERGYPARLVLDILVENFITINSYLVRFGKLKEGMFRFQEELTYLEDWQFLLQLLHAGFRFEALPVVTSEFRIHLDGTNSISRDEAGWKAASLQVRRYINREQFKVSGFRLASAVREIDRNVSLPVRVEERLIPAKVDSLPRRYRAAIKVVDKLYPYANRLRNMIRRREV